LRARSWTVHVRGSDAGRRNPLVEAELPLRTAISGNSVSSLNDPESLRVRAKETRAMAERETDVAVKLTMLTIAAEYEQLAQRTEDSRSGTMRKD
jgi:hypothetical protein